MNSDIISKLKTGPEQQLVIGPLVQRLLDKGWRLEFSILVPGEEQIVLTKEVFVLRVQPNDLGIDPFYMLWALALREVRDQWRRVTLMQTNREDVGKRFCEVCIPMPLSPKWAKEVSCSFRKYFESIAKYQLT